MTHKWSHRCPRQLPGRGPNGRRFCRFCRAEVPRGRRSWCSQECILHGVLNVSRLIALERDKFKCVLCGQRGGLEVDHIIAVADSGTHHPTNLRTLCNDCHKTRTSQQRQERQSRRKKEGVKNE